MSEKSVTFAVAKREKQRVKENSIKIIENIFGSLKIISYLCTQLEVKPIKNRTLWKRNITIT